MAKSTIMPVGRRESGKNGATAPQLSRSLGIDSVLTGKFVGTLTASKIREIRKDPTISMMREVVLAPAVHTEWTITESKNAPAGAREFIEEQILPKRLSLLQTSFFGCLDFGWMPYEKVLDERNGQLVYTKFKQLLHDYTDVLVYVDTGDFAGYFNVPPLISSTFIQDNSVELFEEECLHIILEKEGSNWYGKSVSEVLERIDVLYKDINNSANRYDKKIAGAHWIIYFPVGETTYHGVDTKNHEIALDILSKLEANGAVAVPDEVQDFMDDSMDKEVKGKWRIELLSDENSSGDAFINRLKYLDALKVRAFGIPERSVLEGRFGTKAEAETHTDIGLGTIDVKHRIIVSQYNEQIINQLLRLNYSEAAVDTVRIVVAPLVDSRLSILKDTYRLLLQNPESLIEEMAHLDRASLRDELGLQSLTDEEAEQILEDKKQEIQSKKDREFKTFDQDKREQESVGK